MVSKTTGSNSTIELPSTPSQGDIIYNDGSSWKAISAGTAGQFLKTLGAGANPAWDAAGNWKLQELKNITTATDTVTFSSLPAKKMWKVVYHLEDESTNNSAICLRFNGDSGANYLFQILIGATVSYGTGQSLIMIGYYASGMSCGGAAIFEGVPKSTDLAVASFGGGFDGADLRTHPGGLWRSAATVTSVTVLNGTATKDFTGQIALYYLETME